MIEKILIAAGFYGLLTERNLIKLFISLELVVSGSTLLFINHVPELLPVLITIPAVTGALIISAVMLLYMKKGTLDSEKVGDER